MAERRGHIAIERRGGTLVVWGAIDETARLSELLDFADGHRLVIDLAGVTFINSLGVRDWIRMQSAAQRRGIAIELQRVAEPLIHQLNMIIATRGASRVTSFFAPYACDRCGHEDSLLIDAVAHARGLSKLEAPDAACGECGSRMAFNDFPERYFSFLSV
jgi:anti-anti-sigma regulatory factor